METISTNGAAAHADSTLITPVPDTASDAGEAAAGTPLDALRARPENVHLFRGYGPLVVAAILFVLMVALAPTVAPERVVERPVDDAPTTETAP